MAFEIYASDDGRARTQRYLKDGDRQFCLAEPVAKGTLITEFNDVGEVLNQVYKEGVGVSGGLTSYLGLKENETKRIGKYDGIKINAKCKDCGNRGLVRELDLLHPAEIKDIPIVPLFVCAKCKKRHYSMTRGYLKVLVAGNEGLFEGDELKEIKGDTQAAMDVLNEYVIRIFASKKISRIELE